MLDKFIQEIGPQYVVQVITDNAANYVAAQRMLMERYASLYWTPFAAHCIDLMLEDMGKLPWIKVVIDSARNVTKYLCCMGTRTGGSGTRTSTGYTYRVLGYFNGTSPAVPSRTQIQSHVPGTSCVKIGYLRGFWYAVPCDWVCG